MTTYIAWGNIEQSYPFHEIPQELLTDKLFQPIDSKNVRVQRRHRSRWVAHFFLWELLKMSQKPTALLKSIDYTETGRPELPCDDVDFNISHSGEWVAVILHVANSSKSSVGIDIEYPQRKRNYPGLLAHFTPVQEQAWFARQPAEKQDSTFYLSWCLREAVLKSQGKGIVKLSTVKHDPILQQIESDDCPEGQLVFTEELPFYLAFFVNQVGALQVNCWHWSGHQLLPTHLQQHLIYQVNR
ncbi:4'-phosphopantetheinyl transferase family protein [Pasteurella sp. PK-2025]|uniref:4'-phosphopantetheinyl transferase family protein n=1 Tax=unclassified Pasteurella TaxID=2621516 RepID=UPI003C750C57